MSVTFPQNLLHLKTHLPSTHSLILTPSIGACYQVVFRIANMSTINLITGVELVTLYQFQLASFVVIVLALVKQTFFLPPKLGKALPTPPGTL